MDSNVFIAKARAAGEAAKLRRSRAHRAEIESLLSGGSLVLAGLMLAVLYCVLKHQISI
jgi:hypothetical protein